MKRRVSMADFNVIFGMFFCRFTKVSSYARGRGTVGVRRKVGFIFALLLCSFVAAAQTKQLTVSGIIRDGSNAETLVGVEISSTNSRNPQLSNNNGHYAVKLPRSKTSLTFTMVGYESQSMLLDLTADTVINISLSVRNFEVEELVVTARQNAFTNRGLGKVAINTEQIKYAPTFLGERDIIKYCQMLPGVSAGRDGSSQLAVRGGGGDQTLIVLDDAPVFNQNHAFGYVSIFNSDALGGADLYKSHIPTQYGGRLSSVAALKMRDGDKYEHHQSIFIGTISASVMAEGPIVKGKGSYLVSARRFMPDLLFLRPAWAIRKNKSFELLYYFYDINARVNYQINDRNTIYASFYNSKDKISQVSRQFETTYDEVVQPNGEIWNMNDQTKKSAESGSSFQWANTSASVRLSSLLKGGVTINNTVYYSALSNRENTFVDNIATGKFQQAITRSRLEEVGLRSVVEHPINSAHTLTYGVNGSISLFKPQLKTQKYDGAISNSRMDNMNLVSISVFAEDQFKFGAYKLDFGARVSLFKNRQRMLFAIEPRVALNRDFGKKNSAWITYSRNTQPLFSVASTFMYLPVDFWLPFVGEKLESADQVSIGGSSRNVKNLEISAELYYKKYNNLSYVHSTEDYLMGEESPRTANGYAYGAELMVQYSLPRFSITASYSYARSMRRVDGTTFPYIYDVPHNFNLYSTYTTLQNKTKTHTVSLNVAFRSGLPFSFSNVQFPPADGTVIYNGMTSLWEGVVNYPEFANERMKPYFQVNVSFSMERKKRTGTRTWQFSILNATHHINPNIVFKDGNDYRYFTTMPIMPAVSYKRTF